MDIIFYVFASENVPGKNNKVASHFTIMIVIIPLYFKWNIPTFYSISHIVSVTATI